MPQARALAQPLKFLHAADLHIDSPMRGLERYDEAPVEALRGATRSALENLVQLALDERVDFLLLAGDLYDGQWRDYGTGLFFVRQMARLEAAKIQVFCLYGNHDAESKLGKKLVLPGNVKVFEHGAAHTHLAPELGIAVHGQSFATAAVTEDLAADYPASAPGLFNIGLLHTGLEGRPGHGRYAPTSLDVLRGKQYQYWALGHIHQREVVCEDPWVVFPGNLQGRHSRETGPKGATLVTVDDAHQCTLEERSLDVVRWSVLQLDASECETPEALLEHIEERLEAAIEQADGRLLAARIEVRGTTAAHHALSSEHKHWIEEVRALGLRIGEDTLFIERVKLLTRAPLDLEALRERDDPTGCVARRMQELRENPEALERLGQEFGAQKELVGFFKKLPAEATELDEEGEGLGCDAARLGSNLDEVEQLLLSRLQRGERT